MEPARIVDELALARPDASVLRSAWRNRYCHAVGEALDRLNQINRSDPGAGSAIRESFDVLPSHRVGTALSSPACLWGLRQDDWRVCRCELALAAADAADLDDLGPLRGIVERSLSPGETRILPLSGRRVTASSACTLAEPWMFARISGTSASTIAGDHLWQGPIVDPHPQVTDPAAFASVHDRLVLAFEELRRGCPEFTSAIDGLLRVVVPMRRPAHGAPSSSSNAVPGAIWVTDDEHPAILAEQIVHECTHTLLFLLQEHDPLIDPEVHADGWGPPLVYSPWRDDPRPIAGLLHGAVVFTRVAFFHHVRAATCAKSLARLAALIPQLEIAVDLLGAVRLTEAGATLVERLRLSFDLLRSCTHDLDAVTPIYLECSSISALDGSSRNRQLAHREGCRGRDRARSGVPR